MISVNEGRPSACIDVSLQEPNQQQEQQRQQVRQGKKTKNKVVFASNRSKKIVLCTIVSPTSTRPSLPAKKL